MNYKINRDSVKQYDMEQLIEAGLCNMLNKSGDAAFRVWCHILTRTTIRTNALPHMSQKSAEKGIEMLLEMNWIEIDETHTISITPKGFH